MKLGFKIDKIIVGLFVIFLFKIHVYSQDTNQIKFLKFFKSQSYIGKINIMDTLSSNNKLKYYALVNDEMHSIKEKAVFDKKNDVLDKLTLIEAEMYYLNKNYYKCIPILLDFIAKNKIKNYKDSCKVYYQLKNCYANTRAFNKAIDIHYILNGIAKKHKDFDKWLLMPNLSTIYYDMKFYKEALNQQLLEFDYLTEGKYKLISFYNNRGLFWSKYNNQDSAIACYTLAKKSLYDIKGNTALSLEDEFTIGLIDGNIGQALMKLNEFEIAIPLLKKDVRSSIIFGNTHNAAISQLELSRCYLALNKLDVSKKYLDSANVKLTTIDDYNTKLSVIKQYALYYNKAGLYSNSIDCFNKYIAMKDSMDEKENIKELVNAQVAFQMDEKEKLIEIAQFKVKQKNLEIQQATNIRNMLIVGGILLIVIIIVVMFQLKQTQNQKHLLEINNKEINNKNDIINKSLDDKNLSIKEVHHRVKNNLQIISSLLKLQSSKSNNFEIKNSLKDAEDRINSMALLHQLLYRNNEMSNVLFDKYLESLITQVSNSFSHIDSEINIKFKSIALELDLDRAIPLGLITNELISNAYKHAFDEKGGVITVELVKILKNTYQLNVSDSGKGLPTNFNIHNLDSLGLDIVSILSDQINAELNIYNQNGAHFEITFNC